MSKQTKCPVEGCRFHLQKLHRMRADGTRFTAFGCPLHWSEGDQHVGGSAKTPAQKKAAAKKSGAKTPAAKSTGAEIPASES